MVIPQAFRAAWILAIWLELVPVLLLGAPPPPAPPAPVGADPVGADPLGGVPAGMLPAGAPDAPLPVLPDWALAGAVGTVMPAAFRQAVTFGLLNRLVPVPLGAELLDEPVAAELVVVPELPHAAIVMAASTTPGPTRRRRVSLFMNFLLMSGTGMFSRWRRHCGMPTPARRFCGPQLVEVST